MIAVFVASDESTEVVQPTDRAFVFPAMTVASQYTPMMQRGSFATLAMGSDQLHPSSCQSQPQVIAIRSTVVEQSLAESLLQVRLDECHFVESDAGDDGRQRQALTIDEDQGLSALATFGLADQIAPFLQKRKCRRPSIRSDQDDPVEPEFRAISTKPWSKRLPPSTSGRDASRSNTRESVGISVRSYLGSILDPAWLASSTTRNRSVITGHLSDHCYELKPQSD